MYSDVQGNLWTCLHQALQLHYTGYILNKTPKHQSQSNFLSDHVRAAK